MENTAFHAVTGAFGYSGSYIARRLLDCGCRVRTLTNSGRRRNPFGGRIEVRPLSFDRPDELAASLQGARVLYNTYWVRFNHAGAVAFSHRQAVRNTRVLFEAARRAGVERIVHTSITNPSPHTDLEYFRGKAELEEALKRLGVSWAILRPAVLFGGEDILINNIAWLLRQLPVFGVFGDGQYRIQPIHVDDLAALAVREGRQHRNTIIEAIGPETFTYRGLVRMIGRAIGHERPIVSIRPSIGYAIGKAVGWFMDDVLITREEIRGLMEERLYVDAPPAGTTRLGEWVLQHREELGRHYASELARRRDRLRGYGEPTR